MDETPDAAPAIEDVPVSVPAPAPRWKLALTVLLACVIVAAISVAQGSSGRKLLAQAGLAPRAESYTALSFTRAAQLGHAGLYGSTHVSIGFTMFNHETTTAGDRSIRYSWQIRANARIRAAGTATIAYGDAAHVSRRILVACPPPQPNGKPHSRRHETRRQVTVVLQPVNESIDFWETCDA